MKNEKTFKNGQRSSIGMQLQNHRVLRVRTYIVSTAGYNLTDCCSNMQSSFQQQLNVYFASYFTVTISRSNTFLHE